MNVLETELIEDINLIKHINNLAFSRTATTIGETEAVEYIKDIITKENLNPVIEFFDWTGPKRFLMRILYVIFFVYLVLYRALLVIVFFFAVKYLFPAFRRYSLIQREESKNIYTKISALNQKDKKPVLIFCAHYDSFSSAAPYSLQRVLFFIFRVIIIPYIMLMLFFSVIILTNTFSLYENRENFEEYVLITTSIEFIVIILIFLLIYNNKKSKGSIDNATGVSILIELMKILKKNPPENIDVIFFWSGAEEWGLVGSKRFLKRHKKHLESFYDLDNSYAINIDMVGSYIGLLDKTGLFKNKLNNNLNEIIEASAAKLKVPIIKYKTLIRTNSDYLSFRKFSKKTKTRFQTALFHSAKDSKYIHSGKDTPDKVSAEILNDCLKICYETTNYIDSQQSSF